MDYADYTEDELIELYEERAAILQFDGGLERQQANQAAYRDWRRIVGDGIRAPEWIRERAAQFRRSTRTAPRGMH